MDTKTTHQVAREEMLLIEQLLFDRFWLGASTHYLIYSSLNVSRGDECHCYRNVETRLLGVYVTFQRTHS